MKITRAVQRTGWVELIMVDTDENGTEIGDAYSYVLYPDDPHGAAPALRVELDRMVTEDGFVIEPSPPGGPEVALEQRITEAPPGLTGGPTLGQIFGSQAPGRST